MRILALGVWDWEAPVTYASRIMQILRESSVPIDQRWVGLRPPQAVQAVPGIMLAYTVHYAGAGNFWTLLNHMIEKHGIRFDNYDATLIVQDDAVLPESFMDRFLPIVRRYHFDAAQPARIGKNIAHPHHRKHPGITARLVRMIETGPIAIYNRDAMKILACDRGFFPAGGKHPLWGFDVRFAQRAKDAGLRVGLVDKIPVEHGRPYRRDSVFDEWRRTFKKWLVKNPEKSLPRSEWNTVLEVYL